MKKKINVTKMLSNKKTIQLNLSTKLVLLMKQGLNLIMYETLDLDYHPSLEVSELFFTRVQSRCCTCIFFFWQRFHGIKETILCTRFF